MGNKSTYYEPGIFEFEWVWLKRQNNQKLSSLCHGPYKVHSCLEQSIKEKLPTNYVKKYSSDEV